MKINNLLKFEVQKYINENLNSDINNILLKKNPFPELELKEIVYQIKGKKTAKKKWPFLVKDGLIFPPQLNLEQASSESTALFKSQFYHGENFADLTCGFGIDAYFLSKKFKSHHLVEQNTELLEIVKHNWKVLGQNAKFHNIKLEDFLNKSYEKFDLIYLDPARRDENQRKKVFLEDLTPNIIEIEDNLLNFSENILIKLSPMIDISALKKQVKSLFRIDIISVKNEVKEILIHINKKKKIENCPIYCHNLETKDESFCIDENFQEEIKFSEVQNYIQIPNSSIMKVCRFEKLSQKFPIKKLHPNTHIFTSKNWVENFPGRQFKVEIINKKDIKSNSNYNLIIRNYPLKDIEIKKKFKILDGGNQYLIFTQTLSQKLILRCI